MPIRVPLLFVFTVLIFSSVRGQDSCIIKNSRRLVNNIERTISVRQESYKKKKSEFYIIDITIQDTCGRIKSISFFKNSKGGNDFQINNAIKRIISEWKPFCQSYKRIIIPVFIFFDNVEKSDVPFTISMPEDSGVYVLKTIMIAVSEPVK